MQKNTNFCNKLYFPKLEEIFANFPEISINIEIKTPGNNKINEIVNDLILKYKRDKITTWGVKFDKDDSKLKKLSSERHRFFTGNSVIKTYIFFLTGILPFINLNGDSF